MDNIVLCGMMGCGKTTISVMLSQKYNLNRVDTDEVIVERYGQINKIFEEHGEQYFRDIETQVTKEVSQNYSGSVISLGGGCVLRSVNVEYLKQSGKIFFLRAKAQTLIDRVKGDTSRPLLKGDVSKKINDILSVRTPIYNSVADYIIDTDNLTPEQIADKIMELIK